MNQKLKRVKDAFAGEGWYACRYLIREQFRELRSEEEKYRLWRRMQEDRVHSAPVAALSAFTLLVPGDLPDGYVPDGVSGVMECNGITLRNAVRMAKGEYLLLVQEGYRITQAQLRRLAAVLDDTFYADKQFLYADCDVMDGNGRRSRPFFRPDFSPDTLRSFFYMEGLLVLKKDAAGKLVHCADYPVTGNEYRIALEASLVLDASQIGHVPEVLCHRLEEWGETAGKVSAQELQRREILAAYGIRMWEEPVPDSVYGRIVYELPDEPSVSIIIPSKDNPPLFAACLESIAKYTRYQNYEIILVDNGSCEKNRRKYGEICDGFSKRCRYIYEPMEFNFSRMCNVGASQAQGEYFLFLNDDIEIRDIPGAADWLMRMLGQAAQPHTGAVGAKLLFPGTNLIQHVGVVNYERGADHIFSRMPDEGWMEYGRNRLDYNYSAVTAACMLIAKSRFDEIGGFEERLMVAFNDVELCFRLLGEGYYQVVRNDVVLYHHESVTRGNDAVNEQKFRRNLRERELLFELHPEMMKRDAFYSRNLIQKGGKTGINTDKSYCITTVRDSENVPFTENKYDMTCHIYCVQAEEYVCIRGYAFVETWNNDKTHVEIVLDKNGRQYVVDAVKVYNGTLASALDVDKRLSLAEFVTFFPQGELEQGSYRILVRYRSASGRNECVHRTDQTLTVR